ncbi:MAG: histidine ammonia-lyase [Bacteroidota bacterium]|nr:histidine ammonia-lyase [Bacteroidota bacterium]
MSKQNFEINDEWFGFQQVKDLLEKDMQISISPAIEEKIIKCRKYLDKKLNESDKLFYGINTGFGFLQNVQIDKAQLQELQKNLLQSHACGLGEKVPLKIVKLMLVLKIKSLSFGNSGVQLRTVKRLLDLYNNNVLPVIYTQGSLGASGDLAPLSHLSLPLIGLGEVNFKGKIQKTEKVFKELNWQPVELQSKEGLALINGTQFMSAYGIFNLLYTEQLLKWADVISAISFDAFDCSANCLHEKIHSLRAHKGQVDTAKSLRELLKDSEIATQKKSHVQDPYSFRCIPQVHGATKDTFDHVQNIFLREINSVTDNPNIFPDDDLILSGGNFHGQPLALSLDFLSIAVAELGSISERRVFQLLSGQRDLPLFLVKDPGLHSGLMIPQYTAASIVSENKQLCTPASVDNIPSSNNQEDHNSMGANAATKCLRVIQNVEKVLAIELLTAVQALEYHRPLRSSAAIEKIVSAFREKVSFNDKDRVLRDDMMKAVEFLNDFELSS